MSPLDKITSGRSGGLAGMVERLSQRVGSGDRTRNGVTRRGFFAGAAVAGSALAVDPKAYALTPQSAYATICGPGTQFWDGWSVFCCTVNNGVNSCPPGSFAAGWWKAAGSSWCCGGYQYIVDCNAKCTGCTSGCGYGHICDSSCWSCSCGSGSSATCDQRRHCCNAFRYGQCNTQVACSGGVNCRVLSCVPPYKWANCTTTSLVDDRTAEHGAPCLEGCGPIRHKYDGMGGHGSWLRASLGPERSVGDGRGRYVAYQGGWIYSTTATGAHTVDATVKKMWDGAGGPTGAIGYPTGDRVTLSTGTWYQTFEHGTVCDTPSTQTAVVFGPALTEWNKTGNHNGRLGWPTANRFNAAGGWVQNFQKGAIVDGPKTACAAVAGSIFTRWAAAGREGGRLGFPVKDASSGTTGAYQIFTGGAIAVQPGKTPFAVFDDLYVSWSKWGLTTGSLGWPQGEQQNVATGRGQVFSGGEIWQLKGGIAFAVRGKVLLAWKAAGGATGKYGMPIINAQPGPNGTTYQNFTGGTITVR